MSHEATAWARKQKTGLTSAKFVLLLLADYAGTDYSCWPSVARLADEAELGESTVRAATKLLAEAGLIRVYYRYRQDGSRRSSRYQLMIDGAETMEPDAEDWAHQRPAPAVSIRQDPEDAPLDASGSVRQDSAVSPIKEPPVVEPLALNPGASRNGEVMTGEIVEKYSDPGALFASPEASAMEAVFTDAVNAGQLTRRWIDYCAEKQVKLTTSVIKRYGASVKQALADGFDDALIRRALAAMLADRVASRPALFDSYLIRVQQGPELPPARLTAHQADAERRAAEAGTTAAARLYDTLTRDA